jgi:hypothetical protein
MNFLSLFDSELRVLSSSWGPIRCRQVNAPKDGYGTNAATTGEIDVPVLFHDSEPFNNSLFICVLESCETDIWRYEICLYEKVYSAVTKLAIGVVVFAPINAKHLAEVERLRIE